MPLRMGWAKFGKDSITHRNQVSLKIEMELGKLMVKSIFALKSQSYQIKFQVMWFLCLRFGVRATQAIIKEDYLSFTTPIKNLNYPFLLLFISLKTSRMD